MLFDLEVYPNYMLAGFMHLDGKVRQFEAYNGSFTDLQIRQMERLIRMYELIGFNSKNYDDPILTLMLDGYDNKVIYEASKEVVEGDIRHWEVYKHIGTTKFFESIDLIEVAPGQASLKLYGARLNSKKLQDLPYSPHIKLTRDEAEEVRLYNINDLELTKDLYNKLLPQINLRRDISKKYNIDVLSKSDAQIAESIFKYELDKMGVEVKKGKSGTIYYDAPKSIHFNREDLNKLVDRIEDTPIELGALGQPLLPEWLAKEKIIIGDTTYNIGLGGLHSQESKLVVIPKDDEELGNRDVKSYYPSIIEKMELYPQQLTRSFLDIYSGIKAERLKAKDDADDKTIPTDKRNEAKVLNNVYKIVLNGSYGKFGSKYSFLYSPHLMLTVTFTGQLYLLMLIEMLEENGIKVVSANTDGVEMLYKKKDKKLLNSIVSEWEDITEMEMEEGTYKALYARDVNNYVAVYDGKVKAKGAYQDPEETNLSKNVEYPIVFEAIRTYLLNGTPMLDTLMNCKQIHRFTSSRTVKGGAIYSGVKLNNTKEYDDHLEKFGYLKTKAVGKRNEEHQKQLILNSNDAEYLGKVVRWYYAKNGRPIFYKTGNKVPKTDGSKPMMELTDDIPKDLDYDKYLELCYEHLEDLGVKRK